MSLTLSKKGIKRPTLNEVILYENKDLVDKFSVTYNCNIEMSNLIFNETKKLLWLFNEAMFDEIEALSIDDSLIILDEMWHAFILFTGDYTSFCNEYFGYYIHHKPTTEIEKSTYLKEAKKFRKKDFIEKEINKKRPQYEYVYKKLGEETFISWYVDLKEKFNFNREVSIAVT